MVWLCFTDSYGAVIQTDLQPLKIFMVWFHLKLHHFYMTVCYDLVQEIVWTACFIIETKKGSVHRPKFADPRSPEQNCYSFSKEMSTGVRVRWKRPFRVRRKGPFSVHWFGPLIIWRFLSRLRYSTVHLTARHRLPAPSKALRWRK